MASLATDVYRLICEYCKAQPNERCSTKSERLCPPHAARIAALNKIRQNKLTKPSMSFSEMNEEQLRNEIKRMRRLLAFVPWRVLDTALQKAGVT